MQKYMMSPDITMYVGVKVDIDTVIEFENENVKQIIKDLVLYTESRVEGEKYESVCTTKIYLDAGDVLIFEEEGRGYIKPVENFVTVEEAIEELKCIKDLS